MPNLGDLSNRAVRELIGTRCIGSAVINLQNGTATYDLVAEPDGLLLLSIGGAVTTLATGAGKVLATLAALQEPITGYGSYYEQPVSTTVYYVACINAAGTLYCIQGTYEDQVLYGHLKNGPRGTGLIPDIAVPDTYAPFAVFKIVNGATGVWIPTTTNWDATAVDAYSAPVSVLPKQASDLTFTIGGA
jgi:hypothetical protein